ncbi:flagellar hook-associated protein 1 FlgK [Silvibacterium bohemicum]|uniref:Flagellar hook-associated protein 1 n=1 Tax=Silvibacterium bohemicum TaxID=1577686 RepID=A0A841JX63_9BACT|nr:flagellar hook-associated protein 1 FlgK [Silvibacterium bohemicum]
MSGLNTSLSIGMQALDASEAALNATSNNISNANTPGYTREEALLSENAETFNDGQVTGGGVNIDAIQSVRDELLNLQIAQQTSAQSAANTESASMSQVQTFFSTSGGDIGTALSSLSSSLAALSGSSSTVADQQGVLSAAQSLAEAFNTTAQGLTGAQSTADSQVTQTVAEINNLTQQIAQLNGEVSQVPASQDGGTVEDQRDQLVQQLSTLTGISVTQGSNGEVITTGNGTPLVSGTQSFNLQTSTGTNGFQQVMDSNGNNITTAIQGGQLGGAIQVRDQTIPGVLTQLNTLASQFATAFNAAQAKGTDSNGNAGQPFFTVPTTGGAAAGISVALTNASQIAVSSDGASGSNGNVANLSAALTTALPSGETAANAYSTLVFQVGEAASNASSQSTAIGQSLSQLTNQQGSESAVSIDEETTNLIRYQTAYEAAARIVSTIQQLSTDTLDMGSSQSF